MGPASKVALEHVTLTASSPSNTSGTAVGSDRRDHVLVLAGRLRRDRPRGGQQLRDLCAHSSSDEVAARRRPCSTSLAPTRTGDELGFCGHGASPVITNSRFYASDGSRQYGIYVYGDGGGALDLRNSEVYTYGAASTGGEPSAASTRRCWGISSPRRHSASSQSAPESPRTSATATSSGGDVLARSTGSGFTVTVGASKLVGTTSYGGGAVSCFGNYTGSAFLANTCP